MQKKRKKHREMDILHLPLDMALAGGFVDYARREILDCDDGMVWIEKFCGEPFKVKPLVDTATELSIVEIASVDVDYCCFHSQPLRIL